MYAENLPGEPPVGWISQALSLSLSCDSIRGPLSLDFKPFLCHLVTKIQDNDNIIHAFDEFVLFSSPIKLKMDAMFLNECP